MMTVTTARVGSSRTDSERSTSTTEEMTTAAVFRGRRIGSVRIKTELLDGDRPSMTMNTTAPTSPVGGAEMEAADVLPDRQAQRISIGGGIISNSPYWVLSIALPGPLWRMDRSRPCTSSVRWDRWPSLCWPFFSVDKARVKC